MLAAAARERGVSQAEVARRTGIQRSALSLIFSGQRNLTLRTIYRIANALGCTIEVRIR